MTTTVAPSARPKRRLGDVVFAGVSWAAGLVILAALAGVAIFLTVEGIPGMTAPADNHRRGCCLTDQ